VTTAICGCGGGGIGIKRSDGGLANGEEVGLEDTNVADGVIETAADMEDGAGEAQVTDSTIEIPSSVDSATLDGGSTNTPTGELAGIGGDNRSYSAQWEGANRVLRPLQYNLQRIPFFHFTLDGNAWPTADWGLKADSWAVTCTHGGQLAGIGGDGKVYSETWNGANQMLQPLPYTFQGAKFFAFTLDSKPWPSSAWGIRADSWMIVCF
jgi:hypothetical protein